MAGELRRASSLLRSPTPPTGTLGVCILAEGSERDCPLLQGTTPEGHRDYRRWREKSTPSRPGHVTFHVDATFWESCEAMGMGSGALG